MSDDKPIRFRTSTPRAIRQTLSKVINMTANGELDTKIANTIILACNAALSAIRTDEQERKLAELEKILTENSMKL